MREPMKTGARDNSAAVRVGSAFFFTGGFIGAARVDRWTTGAIVSFERGTRGQRKCGDAGRAGRAGTTRSAERAGGRGNARRRSSRRGGVVRGRAGAAPVETRASSVRLPPAQKVPRRANVSRAFGKNDARRAFEARNGTGRPRRRDRARAGSGRTIAGRTSDTRVRARFSVEARLSRAPRAVSVDPAVKRSDGCCAGAFSRGIRASGAVRRCASRAPRESVRDSTPGRDGASPTSATRAPALSLAPLRASGRGALCRHRARANRFGEGGGTFTASV